MVWTDDDTSEENELFSPTLDVAIEFFNNLYMTIHAEGRTNVRRIDLLEHNGDRLLSYETHTEVLNVN